MPATTYATIDLGSNSFHMVVAEVSEDGQVQVIDRLKEMVQLGGGLNNESLLSEEAMERGVQCLRRFGERIKDVPRKRIRAVGTNTLRQAKNNRSFLHSGNRALNHRIEIISGREEARLIYLGVAHTNFDEKQRRLVVDIGGGSTELIIGRGDDIQSRHSLHMGCINMSRRFFNGGEISVKKMRRAIVAAQQELEPLASLYRFFGWQVALGASGTITSIRDIAVARGWSERGITFKALHKLKKDLLRKKHVKEIDYAGLSAKRAPLLPGGLAVLCAVFETLDLTEMNISEGALREGLLYDLLGRAQKKDTRESSVDELSSRYAIDAAQSARVTVTAVEVLHQIAPSWGVRADENEKLLRWAARLHELGLTIAHSQYHKHGAYLLQHSDLPGFSEQEQNQLSLMVRCHRRKLPIALFSELPEEERDRLLKLTIILRLAVVLNRGRSDKPPPKLSFTARWQSINIIFPRGWLKEHPLTKADIQTETDYLGAVDVRLKCTSRRPERN